MIIRPYETVTGIRQRIREGVFIRVPQRIDPRTRDHFPILHKPEFARRAANVDTEDHVVIGECFEPLNPYHARKA